MELLGHESFGTPAKHNDEDSLTVELSRGELLSLTIALRRILVTGDENEELVCQCADSYRSCQRILRGTYRSDYAD